MSEGGRQPGPRVQATVLANELSETLTFAVDVDGMVVRCIVSREFLEGRYGADREPTSWVAAYQSNVAQIHEIVVDLYKSNGHLPVLLMTDYR